VLGTFDSQHPHPKRSGCRHVAAEERDQPDDRRGGVGDGPGRAETAAAGTYCSPIRPGEGQRLLDSYWLWLLSGLVLCFVATGLLVSYS